MGILRKRNIYFGDNTTPYGFMSIEVALNGSSSLGNVQVRFTDIQFADFTCVRNWEPLSHGLEWVSQDDTSFEKCFIFRVDDVMIMFYRETLSTPLADATPAEDSITFIRESLLAAKPDRADWTNDVNKLMSIT